MRRFLIIFATLVVCSAPTWADSIEYDVNAWATFTAPSSTCSSNCTETLGVSFLYNTPSVSYENGQIVPGTLSIGSSGFLGSFHGGSLFSGYMPFSNSWGDEIDLDWVLSSTGGIQPGINTLSFYMWSCQSQPCDNAYGETWTGPFSNAGEPSSGGSTVTRVAVPAGDSFPLLMVTALGAVGLAWRWRRKEANEAR